MRHTVIVGRRLLICAVVGFACGAVLGVLYVVVGWFPGALMTYAENPQFMDPRVSVWDWSAVRALTLGLIGMLSGLVVGAIASAGRAQR